MNVKVDSQIHENDKLPMIEQIMPLLFAPGSGNYYSIGDEIGKAFQIGKAIEK